MVTIELNLDSFRFVNDPAMLCDDDTLLYRVPEQISSESSLMLWFQANLKFQRGFGRNWDALNDSLRYLDEIDRYRIVLFHEDIPLLDNVSDCWIYLEILNRTVKFWEKYPGHKLYPKHEFVVSFSCRCRSTIVELLKHPLVEQRYLEGKYGPDYILRSSTTHTTSTTEAGESNASGSRSMIAWKKQLLILIASLLLALVVVVVMGAIAYFITMPNL